MKNESLFKMIDEIVAEVFSSSLKDKNLEEKEEYNGPRTIQEYTESTGKRFRVTKDQKERGLSREESFKENMIKLYGSIDF
tara:strand:+ start:291 stop:533 length:243 start_codon:yes stop_codon:yes gene_type:complete